MAILDDINAALRDFNRYTGDGLPNEPVGAPLPVGDATSGRYQIQLAPFRAALVAILQTMGDEDALQDILAQVTAAKDRANHTGTQSADTITNGVTNAAMTLLERFTLAMLASVVSDDTDGLVRDAYGVLGITRDAEGFSIGGVHLSSSAFEDVWFGLRDKLGNIGVSFGPDGLKIGGVKISGSAFEDDTPFADKRGVPMFSRDPKSRSGYVGAALDEVYDPLPPALHRASQKVFATGGYLRSRGYEPPSSPSQFIRNGGVVIKDTSDPDYMQRNAALSPQIAVIGSRIFVSFTGLWAPSNTNPLGEQAGSFVVLMYTDDGGITFKDAAYIAPDPVNADGRCTEPTMDVVDDRLYIRYLHHTAKFGGEEGIYDRQDCTWSVCLTNPLALQSQFVFTKPKFVALGMPYGSFSWGGHTHAVHTYGTGGFGTAVPFAEQIGRLIYRFHKEHHEWEGVLALPLEDSALWSFPEPCVIETDGGGLYTICRTSEEYYEARYDPDDETWSEPVAFTALGETPSSRIDLVRLPSGRVAMLMNLSAERDHTSLCLSEDDCQTWSYTVLLEEGPSSSPGIVGTEDGKIHVVTDLRGSGNHGIKYFCIDEQSVIDGSPEITSNTVYTAVEYTA
ncbi:sialidase family protein [Thioclava sp. GXIMD2076]|uniref:sialidase family protein n=1 Tax=Thioclava sp. GXIMD2076 TaxID=3131931 RepID=UPI0030CB6654